MTDRITQALATILLVSGAVGACVIIASLLVAIPPEVRQTGANCAGMGGFGLAAMKWLGGAADDPE